jgi:hypothetical protein
MGAARDKAQHSNTTKYLVNLSSFCSTKKMLLGTKVFVSVKAEYSGILRFHYLVLNKQLSLSEGFSGGFYQAALGVQCHQPDRKFEAWAIQRYKQR